MSGSMGYNSEYSDNEQEMVKSEESESSTEEVEIIQGVAE